MIIRILGAILILTGSAAVGFALSTSNKRTVTILKQLYNTLEYMEYELRFRQSSLPELLRRSASDDGLIKEFFQILSDEIENQIAPDAEYCVNAALGKLKNVPEIVKTLILSLGRCVGRFDLENQISGITSVRKECGLLLEKYAKNQTSRVRSYQTLALCIGAGLVIMLI